VRNAVPGGGARFTAARLKKSEIQKNKEAGNKMKINVWPPAMTVSARSWTAAALCRFSTASLRGQSGRGLPQSKTLARVSASRASDRRHFVASSKPCPVSSSSSGLVSDSMTRTGTIETQNATPILRA
jgi:hypothetical protein